MIKEECIVRTGVVIATKGRPRALNRLLNLLGQQTRLPAVVIVSASDQADIEGTVITPLNIQYIFGSAGTCMQRNRALLKIRSLCDVVIFFDDDFVPSSSWIEQCTRLFASESSVVGVSGMLIRDGALGEEVSWEEATSLLEAASKVAGGAPDLFDCKDLYGCNMAFRMSTVGESRFDERLVLYGWMEDADFSRTAGRKGRLIQSGAMLGVHLGIKSGRVSGKRYGYSQVVNPWYLHKKGIFTARETWSRIMKPMLMNAARAFRSEAHIDRPGRFGGNIIGVFHLLRGDCRPEAACEFD
jgi:GT2 family glycosyltransferase